MESTRKPTEIGRRITAVRLAYCAVSAEAMAQRDYAIFVGIWPDLYAAYESGKTEPTARALHLISHATGIDLGYLSTGNYPYPTESAL